MFSVFISFQTVISDIDILDILDVVPIPNLGDLYSRLGLTQTNMTNAKEGISSPREAEKKVFLLWRNINAETATRGVILEAMSKDSTWKEWENELRKKWGLERETVSHESRFIDLFIYNFSAITNKFHA